MERGGDSRKQRIWRGFRSGFKTLPPSGLMWGVVYVWALKVQQLVLFSDESTMRNRQANPSFFEKSRQGGGHEQVASSNSLQRKFLQARKEGHLNLSSCKPALIEVPQQVFQLDAYLEEGEKFWEVEPLRSLDVSFNAITTLPPEISSLTTCHTVKARSNRIGPTLPVPFFTECRALRILDIGQNEVRSLPEEVMYLEELREFLLGNNKLSHVPASLFCLPNIRVLDLSNNALEELPSEIACGTLVTLNLSHNKLRFIPSLSALQQLETLNCSSNTIQLLPDLSMLGNIKSIDASQNQIMDFPLLPTTGTDRRSGRVTSSKLNQLVLSFNRLSSLDMITLSAQQQLSELLVHNNALTIIPPEIEELQALKVFDISNNDLQDLPATLGYLPQLQILRLEGNRIRTIRQALLLKPSHELKAYLRTRGPSLVHPGDTEDDGLAPQASAAVVAATNSNQNGLSSAGVLPGSQRGSSASASAPPGPAQKSTSAASAAASAAHAKSKLVTNMTFRLRDINGAILDLSKMALTSLDTEEVYGLLNQYPSLAMLKTLNLAHNQLSTLPLSLITKPDGLCSHGELKSLQLSHNQLSLGPDSSGAMDDAYKALQYPGLLSLDISYNRLSASHVDNLLITSYGRRQSGARFPDLTELVLEHNPLQQLPRLLQPISASTVLLSELRILKLSGCQLMDIASVFDFQSYPFLEHLDISDNKLKSLPSDANLLHAEKLQFLSLENNDLKDIPTVLGLLPRLQTLLLNGNPQRQVRTNILQAGSVRILQYLREKHQGELTTDTRAGQEAISGRSTATSTAFGGRAPSAESVRQQQVQPAHATHREETTSNSSYRSNDDFKYGARGPSSNHRGDSSRPLGHYVDSYDRNEDVRGNDPYSNLAARSTGQANQKDIGSARLRDDRVYNEPLPPSRLQNQAYEHSHPSRRQEPSFDRARGQQRDFGREDQTVEPPIYPPAVTRGHSANNLHREYDNVTQQSSRHNSAIGYNTTQQPQQQRQQQHQQLREQCTVSPAIATSLSSASASVRTTAASGGLVVSARVKPRAPSTTASSSLGLGKTSSSGGGASNPSAYW